MEKSVNYKAGDLVTIRLDASRATALNSGLWIHASEITAHTPAPFDWADVKPGMAFTALTHPDHFLLYVGPNFGFLSKEYPYTFFKKAICGDGPHEYTVSFAPTCLTRAPEHDIEVQS